MDLDEYLWRQKMSTKTFSEKLQISVHTLHKTKVKDFSPSLLNALKIWYGSNKQISLEDLLKSEDRKELDRFLKNL